MLIHVEDDGFEVLSGELGLHLKKGSNVAADITIYCTEGVELTDNYIVIPPEVVIEIDTKANLSKMKWKKYLEKKTKKLFAFGVKKVVWVPSASKQLILAEPNQDWLIRDWRKSFNILPGHSINLGKMLKIKGVK